MSEPIVIVGTGQAGGQLAIGLRSAGCDSPVVLLGAEPHPPYQRPPLSKQYLAGAVGLDRVYLKPAEFYREQGIELRPGCAVTAIDLGAHRLTLADGSGVEYGKLVLATGSRPRRLEVPGAALEGVCYLRTLDHMQALAERLQPGARLVIVGGGYIGLEVAASAGKKGVRVTLLEQAPQLMPRVVGPEIAQFYRRLHDDAGVAVHTDTRVTAFSGESAVTAVRCADGSEHPADVVLVGIGIVPETGLAERCGLAVDNGIVVDDCASTADPDVLAIGDCANIPSAHYGCRLRLESVPNALASARTAAATLMGQHRPYAEVPWFWSDQYDLKLQIAGVRDRHDQTVVRGDPAQRKFMVLYLRAGELIAAEAVNNPREFMTVRQLIAQRARPDPAQLADPAAALAQ